LWDRNYTVMVRYVPNSQVASPILMAEQAAKMLSEIVGSNARMSHDEAVL
jgi:hypothetical protein